MIKNVMDLNRIRFNRLIVDPFPEHTEYSCEIHLFGVNLSTTKPPRKISIWEAYRMGYEKAYKEIEATLPHD